MTTLDSVTKFRRSQITAKQVTAQQVTAQPYCILIYYYICGIKTGLILLTNYQ